MRYSKVTILLFLVSYLFYNCQSKSDDVLEIQEYTGPLVELGHAITYYSDSARVKMRMEAPKQLEFGSGDREFPEGLFLEFFDSEGKSTSTLRADYCYYTKKEDLYKATGNVVVQDVETNDRLDTEELYWNEKTEKVFTDKFVRIETKGDLVTGIGLDAKQDFSYYKILKVQGTMPLNIED